MLNEFLDYKPKFKNNKYLNWYIALAQKIISENRIYNSYTHEYHHILPKCMGGTIMLPYTFREHFIAHVLLSKITSNFEYEKMIYSLKTFFYFDNNRHLKIKRNSHIYAFVKEEYKNFRKLQLGDKNSNADKNIYIFKNKNGVIINATRREFFQIQNDMTIYDINALILNAYKHKKHWESKGWSVFVNDLNVFSNEIPRPKQNIIYKYCDFCSNSIDIRNYSRWHGTKCKQKFICF